MKISRARREHRSRQAMGLLIRDAPAGEDTEGGRTAQSIGSTNACDGY
jgi:hypothetical protein